MRLLETKPSVRFLGIGDYHALGDLYWRLQQSGHDVRVYVQENEAHGIFAGMVERIDDWREQLEWIRAAGDDGIIIFETASMGEVADDLRRNGFHVIGGSAWGDRLERDRAFGQAVMRDVGMQTAPTHSFDDYDTAIEFVRAHPQRYVYKLSDGIAASTRNYVGEMQSGDDVVAILTMDRDRQGDNGKPQFVLMEHLTGIEVGIGGYFDGHDFLPSVCIDWEHKRFFAGDLGELTGEMGTVVSYRGSQILFEKTLFRLTEKLRAANHCGYININTIVNENGVWPLEFTCRFGYPGFAICDALHLDGWDVVFKRMTRRGGQELRTRDGFAVGVVVTVPPFPYEFGYEQLSKGAPIFFRSALTDDDRRNLHFGEVELANDRWITSGSIGYILVVTGIGATIDDAKFDAYARVSKVIIANMRYRNDIGDKLIATDLDRLRKLGCIP